MSNFQVRVQPIFIKAHPNADRLELGNIGSRDGWQVVVGAGRFQTGDLVAYIGENAVVPEWVLKKYGYWDEAKNKGLLAGSKGDRVRMVKLRDEPSLGICIPVSESHNFDDEAGTTYTDYFLEEEYVEEGDDVAELLGVTKYEAPIPIAMSGEVFNAGTTIGVNYDIEDLNNYPDVLQEGEEVQVTVKLHGTNCQLVFLNSEGADDLVDWKAHSDNNYSTIGSKGLAAKGLYFKDNEANANNVYFRATNHIREALLIAIGPLFETAPFGNKMVTVVGEVFGAGIQAGFNYGSAIVTFRIFDVYVGTRGMGRYLDDAELDTFCAIADVLRVPVIYRGPYKRDIIEALTNAPESEFQCTHVREGTVTKPVVERRQSRLGRVALKLRSIAYMSRKGDVTEYQ